MSNLSFSIQGHSLSPTQFKAKARGFSILIDEPEGLGGVDAAPNPVEYLLASYAGCLNVVTHIVANELAIKVRALSIKIDGDINPSRLFGTSYEDRAGFQGLQVDLAIDADATPGQVEHMASEVKKRCPVNDNLANPTPVRYHISQVVTM